jgi:ferric-dicitrate binding protein FerR (iron transport regulator)
MTPSNPGNRSPFSALRDPDRNLRPPRRARAVHLRLLAAAVFVGLLAPAALPLTAIAATPATDDGATRIRS